MYIMYVKGVGARKYTKTKYTKPNDKKKIGKKYFRGRIFFPPLIFWVATQSFLRCGFHGSYHCGL